MAARWAVTSVTDVAGAEGVTETDAEGPDVPSVLLAATVTEYIFPLVSPVIMQEVVVVVQVALPGVARAMYVVPAASDDDHAILACAFFA